ncbi:uncharacterized protein LOC124638834 isoform X1 [Helicoverpa zea]|uniref:uncharacterized protein LOC124638834 isoform X1 n=1 Tax=Helicoverpa zea TaxID=7113 RepID=UPI001F562C50|nr:uncharacterized protein LOC124638834 isoform X1 [Helicoverpa zea]
MASRVWLLVEWVDESNVFPSYGVVNVDTLAYDETDLHPGNTIFMRVKHENPRRAKILRISESKRYVKEQKEILERQDQQVKNVLQLCMRTIKEMKSDNSFNAQQQTGSRSPLPHVVVAQNDDSDSDSDSEDTTVKVNRSRTRNFNKSTPKCTPQYNRNNASTGKHMRSSMNANTVRRRSIVSSTPLPCNSAQNNVRLCYDQGTQTEEVFLNPPASKIEEMETVLKNLYTRFQSLISQANVISNGSISMSESEHNDEVAYIEQNGDSWVDQNNTEYVQQDNLISANIVDDVGAEEVIEDNPGNQTANSLNVKSEEKVNPNTFRVRRMSAQTTNNIETSTDADLVPIGNGNAKVPSRVLNDIDWNSYTSATRQLLQAIFPRRVLATHSLTGKQSPAFLNRPPKKILDPQLVEDIIKTVSMKCGVPKNLVRNSITIKCTDEAKLYRNRQQYKKVHMPLQQINNENIPPSAPSSDESHAVIN